MIFLFILIMLIVFLGSYFLMDFLASLYIESNKEIEELKTGRKRQLEMIDHLHDRIIKLENKYEKKK